MRRTLAALAAVALVALASGLASARAGFEVGLADDVFKLDPASAVLPAGDLGVRAVRVTLGWEPGQTEPSDLELQRLQKTVETVPGVRIVLSIFGANTSAPADDASQEAFCAHAAATIAAVPAIQDVIIWNEPNKQAFWKPQFNPDDSSASPAAYGALLARCYDALHAVDPSVNVIGLATAPRGLDNPGGGGVISHAAATFIERVGDWYRASGRTAPLFDTVSHHPYPLTPEERPWRQHAGPYLGQGDWDKLMNALEAAFAGTAQPLPGQCADGRCVEIWYTEAGVQTTIDDAKTGIYTGTETEDRTVPDDAGGEPDTPHPPRRAAPPISRHSCTTRFASPTARTTSVHTSTSCSTTRSTSPAGNQASTGPTELPRTR